MRFRGAAQIVLALLPIVGSISCGRGNAPVDVERATLLRERDALRQYLGQPPGPLVPFDGFVVVVRDEMLEAILDGVLPLESAIGETAMLTLREARVGFRSGLALVELDGRAAMLNDSTVFADLLVTGAFDVLGIDTERGTLSTRVEVLGFKAADVGVRGRSPPAERLVNAVGSRQAASLNQMLERLEVPIRLAQRLELPSIEESEVSISGGSVGYELQVRDVKVLEDRLWVSVDARISTSEGLPPGPDPASSVGRALEWQ